MRFLRTLNLARQLMPRRSQNTVVSADLTYFAVLGRLVMYRTVRNATYAYAEF